MNRNFKGEMNGISDPMISGMEQHFNSDGQGGLLVGAPIEDDAMLTSVDRDGIQGAMTQNLNLHAEGGAMEQDMEVDMADEEEEELYVQLLEQRMELSEMLRKQKATFKKLQKEKKRLTQQLAKAKKMLDDELEKARRLKTEGPKMSDYVSNMLGRMENPPYVFLSKKLADVPMPLPGEFAATCHKLADNPRPGSSSTAGGFDPANIGKGQVFLTAKMSVTGPQVMFFDYEGNLSHGTD